MPVPSIFFRVPLILTGALFLSAGAEGHEGHGKHKAAAQQPGAVAVLADAEAKPVGEARFFQETGGIRVELSAAGLTHGKHGAHIHMTGRCDPPGFTSAGGHWNPAGKQHGLENPQGAHRGDMPNLDIGAEGKGMLSYVIPGGMITGGDTALLDADGAAMVIHAGPDDMKSDPTGNSGGRIACGVIVKN